MRSESSRSDSAGTAWAQGFASTEGGVFTAMLRWAPLIASGFVLNVLISVIAMAAGTALGLFLGLGQVSPRRWLARTALLLTQFFRNAPWLVLLFFCIFVLPFRISLFGLTVDAIAGLRPTYNPNAVIAADADLARVFELVDNGTFNRGEPGIFDGVLGAMRDPGDPWMTVADAASYFAVQRRAAAAYRDVPSWTRMSILNTAASGRFSSDRSIHEYCRDIWHVNPVAATGEAE